jgi:hypothetical protein
VRAIGIALMRPRESTNILTPHFPHWRRCHETDHRSASGTLRCARVFLRPPRPPRNQFPIRRTGAMVAITAASALITPGSDARIRASSPKHITRMYTIVTVKPAIKETVPKQMPTYERHGAPRSTLRIEDPPLLLINDDPRMIQPRSCVHRQRHKSGRVSKTTPPRRPIGWVASSEMVGGIRDRPHVLLGAPPSGFQLTTLAMSSIPCSFTFPSGFSSPNECALALSQFSATVLG